MLESIRPSHQTDESTAYAIRLMFCGVVINLLCVGAFILSLLSEYGDGVSLNGFFLLFLYIFSFDKLVFRGATELAVYGQDRVLNRLTRLTRSTLHLSMFATLFLGPLAVIYSTNQDRYGLGILIVLVLFIAVQGFATVLANELIRGSDAKIKKSPSL